LKKSAATLCHNVAAMKLLSRVVLVLFSAMIAVSTVYAQAAGATAPTPGSAADLVKQGRKLSSEGKQDEALALFNRALQQDPNFYQAELASGAALDLKGDYAQARQHIEKAIQQAPPDAKPQALRTMAVSYAFERNASEATKYEQQAIDALIGAQKFSDAAGVANELGRILLEAGNIDQAYEWYQKGYQAALRDPKLSPADKNLWLFRWENAQARIAARKGQSAEAQQHVAAAKTALDQANNPDQQRFFPYLTGYVAYYLGDYAKAIADLQKADQTDPAVVVLEAQAYDKSGDHAQAMNYYRKVLTLNNHSPANAYARPIALQQVDQAGKS
jgi:tetratricopeptide (TPR) repeat protein